MYDRADLGTLHPRMKKPLGRRLAAGLHSTAYNGSGPVIGPVLTGCSVEEGSPWQLRLKFNATLLRGQGVLFNASSTVAKEDTALYVACLPHTACSTVIIFAMWRLHAIGTFCEYHLLQKSLLCHPGHWLVETGDVDAGTCW